MRNRLPNPGSPNFAGPERFVFKSDTNIHLEKGAHAKFSRERPRGDLLWGIALNRIGLSGKIIGELDLVPVYDKRGRLLESSGGIVIWRPDTLDNVVVTNREALRARAEAGAKHDMAFFQEYSYPLNVGDEVTIGRNAETDLGLEQTAPYPIIYDSISRKHVTIRHLDRTTVDVENLGTHGTLAVNALPEGS